MAFFDPTRAAYLANPYPSLARLRKEDPVHWSANLRAWIPTRYAECAEVLRDGRRFTTDPALTAGPRAEAIVAHRAAVPMGNVPNLGTSSGARHRALRGIVNPMFTPAAVRRSEPSIVATVTKLLDTLPTGQTFDLMQAFANPLPKEVMLTVMGFPETDAHRMQSLLSSIETTRSNRRATATMVAEARSAKDEAASLIGPYHERTPRSETVLDLFAHSRDTDGSLNTEEVVSALAHIATVGTDPTTGAIANSLVALAERPALMETLRREPSRVRMATHELLRYDCPTHIIARFATMETVLGGRRLHQGDAVLAVVGAANRDPVVFSNPDEVDIARDARRQLGFGQGEHICLGGPLAITIMEAALNGLLQRFTKIELVAPPVYGGSVELRVPDRVMVQCG